MNSVRHQWFILTVMLMLECLSLSRTEEFFTLISPDRALMLKAPDGSKRLNSNSAFNPYQNIMITFYSKIFKFIFNSEKEIK